MTDLSGLHINWEKSEIFPLTDTTSAGPGEYPLTWCDDSVKYLGVHIHRDRDRVLQLNYGPVMEKLEANIERWLQLPLSVAGRIAIIKMVVLPQFLYLFVNIPIPLFNGFFACAHYYLSLYGEANRPELGGTHWCCPTSEGVLASQTCRSITWLPRRSSPPLQIPYFRPEADLALPSPLNALLPRGFPRDPTDIQTLFTTSWAWHKLARIVGTGVLYPGGHIFSHTEDPRLREASTMDQFVFMRIQKALRASMDSYPIAPKEYSLLTWVIRDGGGNHLVAKMYKQVLACLPSRDTVIRQEWERDLSHPLADLQWTRCCTQTRRVSPNHRHKWLRFKFLHRAYVTQSKLHHIDPTRPDTCPRCKAPNADFAHMTWTCTELGEYWRAVFRELSLMVELEIQPSPLSALFGYVNDYPRPCRRYLAIALLLAKNAKWLLDGRAKKAPHLVLGYKA